MKYDKYTNDTYNLYTIETDKFKSIHMEVIFRTPASKENITYLSMLMAVLLENSKGYPSKKTFTRHLYDLYNPNIYYVNSRVGNTILSNIVLDFVDPKYTGKEMLEESIKLPFDMIFNPNINESEFDEATFARIKKRIKSDIEALKEDPKQSSILEAFKAFDDSDIRSLNVTGDLETLESITPKKLYDFYLKFLEHSERDVYIVGSCDMKMVDKIVRKHAVFTSISNRDESIFLDEIHARGTKSISKDSELSQTNLVGIYALSDLTDDEANYVVPLFNMLWGSGSLESKLYKSLRGENSLCYNVSTFYQKYDNVIVLHTAIDEDSTRLALKLINNTLIEMTKGDFTDSDLENVKSMLITSLNLILDSPNRLVDNYLFKNLIGLPDLEDRIDAIRNVTVDDVVRIGKKMKLILSFRLKGE